MYDLSSAKRLLEDPRRIPMVYHYFGCKFNRWWHRRFRNRSGDDFMKEDWDNLIILDAMRYDVFSDIYQHYDLDGRLESRRSPGSHSLEFLEAHFEGREHFDTVYVTANPQFAKLGGEMFHDTWEVLFTDWNEDFNTVTPEVMGEKTLEVQEKYPNKRIISHFIQPHAPFIGETGRKMSHGSIKKFNEDGETVHEIEEPQAWFKARFLLDNVTPEKIWDAYTENSHIVLEEVERILSKLDGKSVITADHGELIGDRIGPIPSREFAHPYGMACRELKEVPWFVVDSDTRPKITEEDPISRTEVDQDEVESRLKDLGYA